MTGPNRALPLAFLVASVLSFGLHFGLPWTGTGSTEPDFRGTVPEPEWTWAHEMGRGQIEDGFFGFGASTAQPHSWALTGLVLATLGSIVWLILARALPETIWSASREAAAASLVAPGLFCVLTGAGMGIGYTVAIGAARDTWAVSIAGLALAGLAVLGTLALVPTLLRSAPTRRTPAYLLVASLFAALLYQVVPWMSTFETIGGETRTRHLTTAIMGLFSFFSPFDALGLVRTAIVVLTFGSIAWIFAIALMPARTRLDPLVDAAFALGAFVAMAFAALGVGDLVGTTLAGMETFGNSTPGALRTGDATVVVGWNAYLFTALLALAMIILVRTLRRAGNDIEEAWSA